MWSLSFIISEIKQDIVRKSRFFHTPTNARGGVIRSYFAKMFSAAKTRMIVPQYADEVWWYVDTIPERDRQTGRQTDGQIAILLSRVSNAVLTRDKNGCECFRAFFSQRRLHGPGQPRSGIPVLEKWKEILTHSSRTRVTDRQTDGRKSDFNSVANYVTLAKT